MIGYGVASRSMYNFNNATDTNDDLTFDGRSIFRHLLYPIYYFMYGSIDGELSALDRRNFYFKLNFLIFCCCYCRKSGCFDSDCDSSFISALYVIR